MHCILETSKDTLLCLHNTESNTGQVGCTKQLAAYEGSGQRERLTQYNKDKKCIDWDWELYSQNHANTFTASHHIAQLSCTICRYERRTNEEENSATWAYVKFAQNNAKSYWFFKSMKWSLIAIKKKTMRRKSQDGGEGFTEKHNKA